MKSAALVALAAAVAVSLTGYTWKDEDPKEEKHYYGAIGGPQDQEETQGETLTDGETTITTNAAVSDIENAQIQQLNEKERST